MKGNEKSAEGSDKPQPPAKDWNAIKLVLVAGAIGGFASWIYGKIMAAPVPGGAWAIPTAIFLGAFAAGIGVFVLTNTDTSALARTLFFAALCGFAWKPVCDAGRAFIDQTLQQKQDAAVQDLGDQAVKLANSLSNTPDAQLPARLQQIDDAAQAALNALPQAHTVKAQREVEAKVTSALVPVSRAAPRHAQAASKLLESVGESAAKNRSVTVSTAALESLQTLGATNASFRAAHLQLQTNILNTVNRRYMVERQP